MAHRVIVAGVDGVGVGFVFTELLAALRRSGAVTAVYEPYLLNHPQDRVPNASAGFEPGAEVLSPAGIHAHCASPLLLAGAHPAHDPLMRETLECGGDLLIGSTKGAGRISAWLAADPALKAVIVLRDVFGALRNARDPVSVLGPPFHPSDEARMQAEATAAFGAWFTGRDAPDTPTFSAAEAQWWRVMTRALLETAVAFPERVLLLDHDTLMEDRRAVLKAMGAFVGADMILRRRRAPLVDRARRDSLASDTIPALQSYHKWYREKLSNLAPGLCAGLDRAVVLDAAAAGARAGYHKEQVRLPEKGDTRDRLAAENRDLKMNLDAAQEANRRLLAQIGASYRVVAGKVTREEVSVVVPFAGNVAALDATVQAAQAQTGVSTQIVVVADPTSPDDMAALGARTEAGLFTLLKNTRRLGPALSRHKGMMAARGKFLCSVDPGDILLPGKLALDVEALKAARADVVGSVVGGGAPDGRSMADRLAAFARDPSAAPCAMTMLARTYRRTAGFDSTLARLENWGFALELAATTPQWVEAGHMSVIAAPRVYLDPDEALFFAHLVLLRHADLLLLTGGGDGLDTIRRGLAGIAPLPPAVAEGLAALHMRYRFVGALVERVVALRREFARLRFRDDIPYSDRVRLAYARSGLGPDMGD